MSPAYSAIVALVAAAVLILLLVQRLSGHPRAVAYTGLLFAIVAGFFGWQAPQPIALAIVALSLTCGIGLLLIPVLEPAVPMHVAEAAAVLLLGTAGAIGLANASDLLQAVVGLETLALGAVTLVALSAAERSLEAAFKYVVLGAISLAGLLYGLGLVYLGTGSLAFPTAAQIGANPLTLAGVVLVGLGFAFELALVPLHWAALDAYTAAAPGLAGFVMSASKVAAAFALGRLVIAAGVQTSQLLVWGGSLTILLGTFGALWQAGDFRRVLAYSAITHAGFIGLALGSGPAGPTTAGFYAATYASMAMLVFAGLSATPTVPDLEGLAGTSALPDLRALDRLRALAVGLGLLSLSGIPPTPGFWAKLAVLVVAWQSAGWLPTLIAIFGGVFSVLYYLRPLPDIFAALRGEGAVTRPVLVPGVVVALAVVVVLSIVPGVAWYLVGGAS
ncbi:MAG TPA: proton-conducting transporter membrane subunit [Chloroflexota bacterium]